MSANDELQAHLCEKMLEFYGNVANNVAQANSQDLTEQWKNGELKDGHYYVKTETGDSYVFYIDDDSYMYDDMEEVLAPVPSYEELQELSNKYDSLQERLFAQAPIHLENQQLKELLKECGNKIEEVMHILSKMPSIERNVTAHSILRKFMSDLDNAIGEKK